MTFKETDYDGIDESLMGEFDVEVKEEEPNEELVEEVEEPVEEVEEVISEEPDTVSEPAEDSQPHKTAKSSEKSKSDAAMARMRIEKAEAERAAKEQQDFLNQLAAQAGFTDVSQFKEAVSKEISKKQAEAEGITPEAYEKMRKLEERVNAMEAEKKQAEAQFGAQRFTSAIEKFVTDYKLGEKGKEQIFERLGELGYEVDDLLIMKAPEVFIKGAMADVIQSKAVQTHLKQKETKAKVDSDRIDTSGNVQDDSWEAILNKDLADYASTNGYSR